MGEGVPKGAGKITSSGNRGGEDIMNKAAHPFGGLQLTPTTAMPLSKPAKSQ